MIAHINQGQYLDGMIGYNLKKEDKGEAKLLSVTNVFDNSVQTAQKILMSLASQRNRKDSFMHIFLNFPKHDKPLLTDKLMMDIANDYLTSLGFGEDHPTIIYKHQDTEHPHLHLITSKIMYNNILLNDSHIKRRSTTISRKLEKKYGLYRIKEGNRHEHKYTEAGLINLIKKEINETLKEKQPKNLQELERYINLKQLGLTELENGTVFHRIDQEGKRIDKGIPASKVSKSLVKNELLKSIDRTKGDAKKQESAVLRKASRTRIQNIIKTYKELYRPFNIDEFIAAMATHAVKVNHKYDSKENLVGLSFIDTEENQKFTGEQLGRSYKAMAMRDFLSNGKTVPTNKARLTLELLQLRPQLEKYSFKEQLTLLAELGYRIRLEKNQVKISDPLISKQLDSIFYRKVTKKDSINIDFMNNLDKKNIFTYNLSPTRIKKLRSSFIESGKIIIEQPKQKIKPLPQNPITKGINPLRTPNQQDTSGDDNQLSDIDKKRKKKKGRGI